MAPKTIFLPIQNSINHILIQPASEIIYRAPLEFVTSWDAYTRIDMHASVLPEFFQCDAFRYSQITSSCRYLASTAVDCILCMSLRHYLKHHNYEMVHRSFYMSGGASWKVVFGRSKWTLLLLRILHCMSKWNENVSTIIGADFEQVIWLTKYVKKLFHLTAWIMKKGQQCVIGQKIFNLQ